MLVTAGRPCGPCCKGRKALYLRTGALFISLFEVFFGCAVIGACFGITITNEITERQEIYWLNFQCIWQAICALFFTLSGIILLAAHVQRSTSCCILYIVLVILVQLASLTGLGFTFFKVPAFNLFIPFVFLRVYFCWVTLAYYLEIKLYPDGFPPPPRQEPKEVKPLPEVAPKESSLHYKGDG